MLEKQQSENPSEENLFDKMLNLPPDLQSKKLHRSKSNVVLTGVCSGIADYLKIDVANIRIIALLSLLIGGWSIAAYLITALLLPVETYSKELTKKEKIEQQKENFRVVLSGLFIVTGFHFVFIYLGIGNSERVFILPNGFVFPIAAITAGIFILTKNNGWYTEHDTFKTDSYFRSRTNKKVMGVCAGLSKYLNIDTSALRIIFILATLLTLGMFALCYILFSFSTQFESEQRFEK